MRNKIIGTVWILFSVFGMGQSQSLQMACSYGPRGSLTAICINATSRFFKQTNYRFDYLDETLKCINCTLDALDAGTFDISGNEIKILDIRNSSITKIWPKAFIGMIYMEKLLLSDNPITNIYPEAFSGIRKVTHLELENAVSHLEPLVFQELHQLEFLSLRRNNLDEIKPGTFNGLSNLRILDLGYNQLRHLNDSFNALSHLKVLRLNDNFIRIIYGNEFNNLKTLLLLNLQYNSLSNFTLNIDINNQLRVLNLQGNRLSDESFKSGTFTNLNNLEELDLSQNLFTKLPSKFFQGLYRLRILNFYGNSIQELNTGSFSGLPHLRNLNVSKNHLKEIKITGKLLLHSLHTLDMSYNDIIKFDYLSLIRRAPNLFNVYLIGNNLSCTNSDDLETLLAQDNIEFYLSNEDGFESDCPKVQKTTHELVKDLAKQLVQNHVNSTLLVWMYVLITIAILLLAVLFYGQFFILRTSQPFNIRIMKILGSSEPHVV